MSKSNTKAFDNNFEVTGYHPTQENNLEQFYLPVTTKDVPQSAIGLTPPVHILGVKGGVGTTTLANIINQPDKVLDISAKYSKREFISYLSRVILVTNRTYSSLISLQAVMQQITSKTGFSDCGFDPRILGIAVVDNTNIRKTDATNKLLDYIASNIIRRWDFEYVPTLCDVLDPNEAGLPSSFYQKAEEMAGVAAN